MLVRARAVRCRSRLVISTNRALIPLNPSSISRTFSTSHALTRHSAESSELFEYTSGRWIFNESLRLAERRRVFNVPELKRLAAESINQGANDVARFEKFAEGSFNRVFLVTMNDGTKLIARIPYPLIEPKYLVVASEVATLDYLRLHDLPVPKVFGYSATSENAAGTEYIFMEYMRGRSLGDLWYGLSEDGCSTIIRNIVNLEARLFKLQFPASGSLYYTADLYSKTDRPPVPIEDPPSNGRFSIGPETTPRMWFGKRRELQVERGPYETAEAALTAGAKKELAYLARFGKRLQPLERVYRGLYGYKEVSHLGQVRNLEDYLRVAPYLVPENFKSLCQPTIRHPDWHPNNILVSDDLTITGLLDWQHGSILPLFLNCGFPQHIWNCGDEVSESLDTPKLPSNFDDLDDSDQLKELEILRKRRIHHYYAWYSAMLNPIHTTALDHGLSLMKGLVFNHASNPWDGDMVSLKADLIYIAQNWDKLSNPSSGTKAGVCPLEYSNDEANSWLMFNSRQIGGDAQILYFRNHIGCGPDGWVPSDQYDKAKQREMKFKETAFEELKSETTSESDLEKVWTKMSENWMFDDFDEGPYQ
ncbi:kinase-like domain-containing protein [Aspergillus transmontanensis]|uniref:Kinase-like domain-containing protein n=1 Tax=Aspergillus transmontanensis TaxID=1034304 RepID=A0A5N6WBZ6_9EURO|nr:kinase-like domain-containing protein [Aspergillus transmontanensis]